MKGDIRRQIENYFYYQRLSDTEVLNKYWFFVKIIGKKEYLCNKEGVVLSLLIWYDVPELVTSIHNAVNMEKYYKNLCYQ